MRCLSVVLAVFVAAARADFIAACALELEEAKEPKSVPAHKLRKLKRSKTRSNAPGNVLPGVVSELSKGFDITQGDPNQVKLQIFEWSYDMKLKQNWNGKLFAIPDQMSIFLKNVCTVSEIQTTSMSYSYSDSTTSQGESWTGGFDQKVDFGISYEGVGVSTQFHNGLMFGNSKVSTDYESQFHQKRTMSMNTYSRAEAYSMHLYHDNVANSWFHDYFKAAVQEFAGNPTRDMAFDFIDDYGTHFFSDAHLGGSAQRNIYFEETIDEESAMDYYHEESSVSVNWLWFGGSKSDSETTQTQNSSGHYSSVFKSSTYIIGGDPSADTPGEFCASLEKFQTPRVQGFKRLIPIADVMDLVEGVPTGTGQKMMEHLKRFMEDGEACAKNVCGGKSVCSWNKNGSRSWTGPCRGTALSAQKSEL